MEYPRRLTTFQTGNQPGGVANRIRFCAFPGTSRMERGLLNGLDELLALIANQPQSLEGRQKGLFDLWLGKNACELNKQDYMDRDKELALARPRLIRECYALD